MMTLAVIYADPPWAYSDKGYTGGIGLEYQGMPFDQLAQLRVPELASKDCLLFMWATWPFLFDALCLIKLWGFEYLSKAFVWVKVTKAGAPSEGGLGRWVRGNTEFCLLARRGRVQRQAKNVQELITSEVGEEILLAQKSRHSVKPLEVRDRIVRLVGDVPRIELFARERVVGWDAWGNEVPGGSDVEL
jgi:N6-adenosine-specific RNA methylase IME4